jgi:hypothetical protein
MEPSPMRRVKEAFVVADTLKAGPFHSPEALLASIEKSQREVTSWTDNQIDAFIAQDNPNRLRDYDHAHWKLDRVDLERCIVWRSMGDRPWAEGGVMTVADLFKCHESRQSRIWDMQKFGDIFSSRLPIIVFPVGARVMIDDGSHRAVAMALAGVKSAVAWIGLL